MARLIKLYFINNLKLNRLLKGPGKGRMWGFLLLMLFAGTSVIVSVTAYSFFLGDALAPLGLLPLMPAVFMLSASVVAAISALFSTKTILFGARDVDLQLSLPIPLSKIVAAKIIILYIYEFIYTLVIILPALIVYAVLEEPPFLFFFIAPVSLILVPLLPVIIGVILGTLISIIAARFRGAAIIRFVLLLIFTLAMMALSFSFRTISIETAMSVAVLISSISAGYPPIALFSAAISGSITDAVLFALISIIPFAIFVLAVGKFFKKINSIITSVFTRGNYKITEIKSSGLLSALFFKELKIYFNSALYVLNTAFGMILLLIASVAAFVAGAKTITELLNIPMLSESISRAAPFAIALPICMSSSSCSSISMEGSRFWLLKTLPVPAALIFKAKIAVNLLITVPPLVISAPMLALAFNIEAEVIPFLFITPLIYCFLISILGLLVNLMLPKLEWKSEVQVIKQSASVVVTMLFGFVLSLIPLTFQIVTDIVNLHIILTVVIACITAVLAFCLFKFGSKRLWRI